MIFSAFRTLVRLSNRRVILLIFDPLQSCNYVSQAVVDSLSQSGKLIDSESGRNSEHKDLIYHASAWATIPSQRSSILPTDQFYLIVGRKWLQRERVEVFADENYCTIRDLDYPGCLFKFPAYVPKVQRSLQVKTCQPDSQVALKQKLESTILPTVDDAQVEAHCPLTPTMVESKEMIENVAMTDSIEVRETAHIVESWDHSLMIEADLDALSDHLFEISTLSGSHPPMIVILGTNFSSYPLSTFTTMHEKCRLETTSFNQLLSPPRRPCFGIVWPTGANRIPLGGSGPHRSRPHFSDGRCRPVSSVVGEGTLDASAKPGPGVYRQLPVQGSFGRGHLLRL
ncbi:hypothetical protein Taro_045845 [Colocasia esculenta]|uniref:Uncharacterized protein n=1 Tax=Colocasia esculenta TaxID=4460 RepID=A0A843WN86_COLES|nr:hypothetical protein [Colocasia esculenta]